MNRDEFFQTLLTRNSSNFRGFDQSLESRLGAQGTVLVCDSSGFTRITRARGILHFLSLLAQSYQLSHPIVARHGGVLIKSEADNLIARFDDPVAAVRCAMAIQRAHQERNSSLPEDEHFHLAIGLDYGSYLLLEDDAFGDAVNIAYKVGEDLASADEILVTDRWVNQVGQATLASDGIRWEKAGDHDAGQVPVSLFRVLWGRS